ncbi:MAG: diguanylate cyclase, partial [Christensenella sp.]
VICAVAEKFRSHFRKEDVIARMGGDEFIAFVENITDISLIENKARQLCESMSDIMIDAKNAGISCSIGIAISTEQEHSFLELYKNSDKALYSAKCRGKNLVSIYGENMENTSIAKWINNAESVLDAIKDSIYVCDKDTYELIYANDSICKLKGVTREACKGKKCYEVLMHSTKPCKFCSMPNMVIDKMYNRLFRFPDSSRVFLLRGRNINRSGTIVHLEIAVDVTEVYGENLCWSDVSKYENDQ